MTRWDDEEDTGTDEEFGWDSESDDESTPEVPCPNCGRSIYSESERCPYCGEPVEHAGSPIWLGKPAWYVLLGVLGVIAVLVAMSGVAAWL